jgi:FkbM family methyltransferase
MSRWWNTRRFDLLEFSLMGVFMATAATVVASHVMEYAGLSYVTYSAAREGARLKDRYGPTRFSENAEEWVIRDYFQDRRGGYFVDVGANHYRNYSNTFYLESVLGWSGVAIDPQAGFAADYRTYRPRTRFFPFFVSDTSDASVTFYEVDANPLVASADRRFAERAGTDAANPLHATAAVTVPTIRLTDLLDRAGVSRFDLLSVDVELAEPKVLAGFDINRFKPSLVCIEAHPQVRQQILDYFAAHGYVLLGRYLRADLQNLYFAPLGPADQPPLRTR